MVGIAWLGLKEPIIYVENSFEFGYSHFHTSSDLEQTLAYNSAFETSADYNVRSKSRNIQQRMELQIMLQSWVTQSLKCQS